MVTTVFGRSIETEISQLDTPVEVDIARAMQERVHPYLGRLLDAVVTTHAAYQKLLPTAPAEVENPKILESLKTKFNARKEEVLPRLYTAFDWVGIPQWLQPGKSSPEKNLEQKIAQCRAMIELSAEQISELEKRGQGNGWKAQNYRHASKKAQPELEKLLREQRKLIAENQKNMPLDDNALQAQAALTENARVQFETAMQTFTQALGPYAEGLVHARLSIPTISIKLGDSNKPEAILKALHESFQELDPEVPETLMAEISGGVSQEARESLMHRLRLAYSQTAQIAQLAERLPAKTPLLETVVENLQDTVRQVREDAVQTLLALRNADKTEEWRRQLRDNILVIKENLTEQGANALTAISSSVAPNETVAATTRQMDLS